MAAANDSNCSLSFLCKRREVMSRDDCSYGKGLELTGLCQVAVQTISINRSV